MGQCSSSEESISPPSVLFGEPVGLLRRVTHRLLERFTVQPYGVLGASDLGPHPGLSPLRPGSQLDAVVVDSAKVQEILDNAPFAAKGVSMPIYAWLGINSRGGTFPEEVCYSFQQACGGKKASTAQMAKYHCYGEGQHVIHAAGPRLRKLDQSLRELVETYAHVLLEFCEAIGPGPEEGGDSMRSGSSSSGCSAPRRLRLLPISSDGGVVMKELLPQMGRIFWCAIAIALERLPTVLQRRLESAVVEVCVYRSSQVRMFENALGEKWECGGLHLGQDWGQLRTVEGSHDWICIRNTARDRFMRLAAASASLRAVWEQGYVCPDGRGVGLNHVNQMLAGTRVWRDGDTSSLQPKAQDEASKRALPKVQACVDESATVVELAAALARKGRKVSAVAVSSPLRPGADLLTGDCYGVEEEWCITTTLLKSLQHAQFLRKEAAKKQPDSLKKDGKLQGICVISPSVEVFRESHDHGYMFVSEPATLCSVVSILPDDNEMGEAPEEKVRHMLRTLVSAAIESGAEVLVCPYSSMTSIMDVPVTVGGLLGEVLREPRYAGLLDEVVIQGNRSFAQATASSVRGEPLPEVPVKAAPPDIDPTSTDECPLDSEASTMTQRHQNTISKSVGKTPRHSSSTFLSKHYTEIKEIGRGAFGRVTLVRENATGDERVCKTVSVAGMKDEMINMLKKEAELLRSLDHPGIVRLYEYAEDSEEQVIILVLEHVPGGGCDDLLAQALGVPLSESLVVKIVSQVLATLAYCHARGVVHRDVKPENIMLTCRPLWRSPDVKLIDFGAAAGHEELKGEVIGTVEYMPPEVIKGKEIGSTGDMWALGASVFELLHGEPPFGACDDSGDPSKDDGCEALQKRILRFTGNFDDLQQPGGSMSLWHKWQCRNQKFWERSTPEAQDFMRWLLNPDPRKRPTAVEALEHPWLEMHRPKPSRITSEMATSLASYVKAPKVVQCCMVLVAASLGAPELEDVSAAFLGADKDCDGKLSLKELKHALADIVYPPEEQGQNAQTPVKDMLLSGDLDMSDGLGFTEFLAACLFDKQASLDRLIEEAFHALDVDRDGLVLAEDTQGFFESPSEGSLLSKLPASHAFCLEEWCINVKASITGMPVAEVAAAVAAAQKRVLPLSGASPTLRIRRRGPRGCC